MRTAIIIAGGFVLLAIFLFAGRLFGRPGPETLALGAKIFIPIWLAAALVNLWLGTKAGYTVTEELPIFLVIFALPAAAAVFVWWRFS